VSRSLSGKKFLGILEPERQDSRVPLEETMNAMARRSGISLIEDDATRIEEAAAIHQLVWRWAFKFQNS